jgi:four helix bundle protein
LKIYFDHEKLTVYQHSIQFVGWCEEILQHCEGKAAVKDQLDRASTSIPLNIAEGNGKFSAKDRSRFLDIARSSALESAACLDVLVAKGRIHLQEIETGKEMLREIVSMLVGLKRTIADRVGEEQEWYGGE